MFNKNNTIKTKTIGIMAIFIFVISFAIYGLVGSTSKGNQNNIPTSNIEDVVDEPMIGEVAKVKWVSADGLNVQQTAITSSESEGYSFAVLGGAHKTIPDTIVGGTRINVVYYASNGKFCYRIRFDANGDGDLEDIDKGDGYVNIVPKNGYRLTKVFFGNKDENKLFYWSSSFYKKNSDNTYSEINDDFLTPEMLDPNYSGELCFSAGYEPITYSITLYDKISSGTWDPAQTKDYTIKSSATFDQLENKEDKVFDKWLFDAGLATKLGYQLEYDSHNETLEVLKDNELKLLFALEDNNIITIASGDGSSNSYYSVGAVMGYGELPTIGSLQGEIDQPLVFASWKNIYYAAFYNANTTHWDEVGVSNPENLRGAYVNISDQWTYAIDEDRNGENPAPTMTFSYNESARFNSNKGQAFFSLEEFKDSYDRYFVYNYGHEVDGYFISVSDGTEDYLLDYNYNAVTGEWSFAEEGSETSVPIEDLTSASFGSLASFLDEISVNMEISTNVTITPDWKPVDVSILLPKNNSRTGADFELAKVTFGETYSLPAYQAKPSDGQTVFGFMWGDEFKPQQNFIPNSNIWDYSNIPSGQFDFVSTVTDDVEFTPEELTPKQGDWFYLEPGMYYMFAGDPSDEPTEGYWKSYPKENMAADSKVFTGYLLPNGQPVITGIQGRTATAEVYCYQIKVVPNYVDNIYRVGLDVNKESLTLDDKSEFTFDSSANTLSLDTYSINMHEDYVSFNAESYKTSIYYTNALVKLLITWYNELENFNGYKKVFYTDTNATLNDNVLTLTEGCELFIWLPNGLQEGIEDYLPVFADEYESTIGWWSENKNYAYPTTIYEGKYSNAFGVAAENLEEGEDGGAEELSFLKEGWNKSECGLTISPELVYTIRGYYKPENSDSYKFIERNYHNETLDIAMTLEGVDGLVAWYLDIDVAFNKGYNITQSGLVDNQGEILLSKDGLTHTFTVSGLIEDKKYNLTHIRGDGAFIQDETNPIIKAKLSKTYKVIVDNTGADWSSMLTDDELKQTLYGAYSLFETEDDGNFATSYLSIHNSDKFAYDFKTSDEGSAFFKYGNISWGDVADYHVFNYGYNVSGWMIVLEVDLTPFWLTRSGSSWVAISSDDPVTITLEDLVGVKLNTLADFIDSKYPDNEITITLKPKWSPVAVKINNGIDSCVTTFNADYELIYNGTKPAGQEFVAYQTEDEQVIAYKGVWNYYSLNTENYCYEEIAAGQYGYVINVEPIYLDNIYKVELQNAIVNSDGYYEIENTGDFKFAKTFDYVVADEFTFKTLPEESAYLDYSTGLIDDYIASLEEFISHWQNQIESASYNIFKEIHYSNGIYKSNSLIEKNAESGGDIVFWIYLANNQSLIDVDGSGVLPMFKNENAMLIFWKDVADSTMLAADGETIITVPTFSAYLTDGGFENETLVASELNLYTIIDSWTYATSLKTIIAHYVYSINLYYEKGTSQVEGFDCVNAGWFGDNSILSMKNVDDFNPKTVPVGKTFETWMFDAELASESKDIYGNLIVDSEGNPLYGYEIIEEVFFDEVTSITVKSSDNKVYLRMSVGGKNPYHNYYYITAIQGTGIFEDNKTSQNGLQWPILRAKWQNEYMVTLNNADKVYWKSKGVENSELYGAYSTYENNNGDDNNFATASFLINSNSTTNYSFMSSSLDSMENAFYKKTDWEGVGKEYLGYVNGGTDYYYVYNYGHYITGWEIIYGGSDQQIVYTEIEGSGDPDTGLNKDYEWRVLKSNVSRIANLKVVKFNSLVQFLDDYYATDGLDKKLTLIPIWEGVKVNVVNENDGNILYGSGVGEGNGLYGYSYTSNSDSIETIQGKQLFAYETSNNDLIALSGVWNYMNLDKDLFSYATNDNVPVYTLNVSPVFVDNIYKISLIYAAKYDSTKYILSNDCGYVFNDSVVGYEAEYNYLNYSLDGYAFVAYHERDLLMDGYISKLNACKTQWENGIKGGFSIFNKVYYSEGTAKNTTVENDTLETLNSPNLSVYLTEGQVANLPVFLNGNNTLIFWKNMAHHDKSVCVDGCSSPESHMIYRTVDYNETEHAAEIEGYTLSSVWSLSDGVTANGVQLRPFYYRKNYVVNIETYVDGKLDNRGYAFIDVEDTIKFDGSLDKSGYYMARFNGTEMKVYQLSEQIESLTELTNITLTDIGNQIKLYSGCDITLRIVDQSQDVLAVKSGDYDNMVGYKFTEFSQTNPIFENSLEGTYSYHANHNDIDGLGYANGTIIELDIFFEKIEYKLTINMTNSNLAGQFNVQTNSTYSGYRTQEYVIENVTVGNLYRINYFAFAGFKLKNNSFELANLKTHVLQTYDEDADKVSQTYTLASNGVLLDAAWLREYFYFDIEHDSNDYADYDVSVCDLGILTINTDKITFNYGVKIYDETDANPYVIANNNIVETFYYYYDDDGVYQRSTEIEEGLNYKTLVLDENGTATTDSVGLYLTDMGDFYYYESIFGVKYALMSSRLYYPKNFTTQNNNHYTTYNFLLQDEPTATYTLDRYYLAYMVDGYEDGKIIDKDSRNLYIMLQVRKLLEIEMKVAVVDNDTNSTVRTTSITNSTNNSKDISIPVNAQAGTGDNAGYYLLAGNATTSVTIYTYYGLENRLTSVFNSYRYDGVEYYLNSSISALSGLSFVAYEDSELVIKYRPRALTVQYKYTLDGKDITEDPSVCAQYIKEIKPNAYAVYYLGQYVEYAVQCIDNMFNVRVTINGDWKGTTNMSDRVVRCQQYDIVDANGDVVSYDNRYKVVETDYGNSYGILVSVEIMTKDDSKISVVYTLEDSTTKATGDDYGTMKLAGQANGYEYLDCSIAEGLDVVVETMLNTGYVLTGKVKHNLFRATNVDVVDGKIALIEDYDPETDSGDYAILIKKVEYMAVLNTAGSNGKYLINGQTSLNKIYVGSTISFTSSTVEQEEFKCFYYTNKDGEKVYLTDNGNIDGVALTELTITSAEINNISSTVFQFGVVVLPRHKLEIEVTGKQYLSSNGIEAFTSSGAAYRLGSYCDAGEVITFSVRTKNPGKYQITFNGGEFIYNSTPTTQIVVDQINKNEIKVTLDADYVYKLKIEPKTFNVEVEENLFETITQIDNNSPTSVVDGQVNNMQSSGQRFNDFARLEFAREVTDRALWAIYITDNDRDDVVIIEFNGKNYLTYRCDILADGSMGERELITITEYGYELEVTRRDTIILAYRTVNNISIRLDYKDYKIIKS